MHFALDDQIASQPQAMRTLLARISVPSLDPARPILFSGIGTSLHACKVAAFWLNELTSGQIRPTVVHAHDLALATPLRAGDQVIVVSHRGTKRFPNLVLSRARSVGATTIVITGEEAPQSEADVIIRTCPGEKAGTHTVSYTTALLALGHLVARLAGERGEPFLSDLAGVPDIIEQILTQAPPSTRAQHLQGSEPILVTGSGIDALTAAEAALKIKEGTYQWAEGMETENALHGPPAALRPGMATISITSYFDNDQRTTELRTMLATLGVISITCGNNAQDDLYFPSVNPLIRPLVAIVPLQRLVAELARLNHANPDAIHSDVDPWKTAMSGVKL